MTAPVVPVAPAIELPVDELLTIAQEHMDALRISEAQQTYERALLKYPDNANVLDSLSELLFSLGEAERAIKVSHSLPI